MGAAALLFFFFGFFFSAGERKQRSADRTPQKVKESALTLLLVCRIVEQGQ